jgi:predicted DNA-binding transcriptional regulator AlpA
VFQQQVVAVPLVPQRQRDQDELPVRGPMRRGLQGGAMTKDDMLLLIETVRAIDGDKAELRNMFKEVIERLARIEARLTKPVLRKSAGDSKKLYVGEVMAKTGMSRGTIYKLIKDGEFPASTRVPGKMKATWLCDEVDAWIASTDDILLFFSL